MLIPNISRVCVLFVLAPLSLGQGVESAPFIPPAVEAGDWQSIRSVHESAEHRAYPQGEILHARNTRQGWLMMFDGEGFLVKPRSQNWSWGLQLESYGFDQAMQEVEGQAIASIEDDMVRYDWNSNLQEWYVNGALGLEHGYTILERPVCGSDLGARLVFDLTVRGNLLPEVMDHGKGIRFLDRQGSCAVTYTGLHVFDANGVTQSAEFVDCGAGVRISIAESNAVYPLTIDPVAQEAYLKASNTGDGDRFGSSVAMSGDIVVVGAPNEDGSATGVNGNQAGGVAYDSGAAYVFERIGGVWSQTAYLKPSNTAGNQKFGLSVAASGNTIVVGAIGDSSDADGVNGNQSDTSAPQSGAAHVYEKVGGVWTHQAYLKATNSDEDDLFALSVAVSGELIVVGARNESSDGAGVNGSQGNNNSFRSGAAYVYERTGSTWIPLAFLKASNSERLDSFGEQVAISGSRIAVSSIFESSTATGVGGDQNNNNRGFSGAVYAFEYSGGGVTQEAYIKATDSLASHNFGSSLSIDGNTLVVGSNSKAHVFDWSAMGWSPTTQLGAPNFPGQNVTAVGVSGDHIILTSPFDPIVAHGINDDSPEGLLAKVGGAYHYKRISGVWEQHAYIKVNHPKFFGAFGSWCGISNGRAVIGMEGDESNATGVNGDPTNSSLTNAGAAFVYDLAAAQTNYCGIAEANSSGLPGRMSMSGSFTASDNAFTLHATDLPTGQFGYFLNSMGQGIVMNPAGSQGNLCVGGGAAMGRHNRAGEVGFSDVGGQVTLTLDLTNMPAPGGSTTVVAGEQWNFQCWYRDVNPSSTSNFTDGLWVQFD